jgi:hypothetical protein
MYGNEKMKPAENSLTMGRRGIKEYDEGGDFD